MIEKPESATSDQEETAPRRAQRLRILVSGGGTGGHIYPALAVARELVQYGAELLYIGDDGGLETHLVPQAGIRLVTIHAGKLRRYWSAGTLRDLLRVPIGFREAAHLVRNFAPHAAFTSGGYVAVPAGFAARRTGAPLVIHQQDVSPNLANRLLRPLASRISVSFDASLRYFPKRKTSLVGNPVRDAITALAGTDPRVHKRTLGYSPAFPLLLITGGSQGALHINEALADALPTLLERFQILHISGQGTHERIATYAAQKLTRLPQHVAARYRLVPYLNEEMPVALAAADVVIGRAGAATLAELSILGKPSILIPLPPGFGGSPQEINAGLYAREGASLVIHDKELHEHTLTAAVSQIFAEPAVRLRMATAARTFARPNAARELAATVVDLANQHLDKLEQRAAAEAEFRRPGRA